LAVPVAVDGSEIGPELARVVEAWTGLPEAVKAGILAMVEAARKERDRG
jgi:hypothetical protein